MTQTTTEESTDKELEELISEIEEEDEDDYSETDVQRAIFSMALSVVSTSILMQTVAVFSGVLVGVALWFIISVIISNTFKLAGWKGEEKSEEEMSDIDVLKIAYKRGLINDEQFEESLENNLRD